MGNLSVRQMGNLKIMISVLAVAALAVLCYPQVLGVSALPQNVQRFQGSESIDITRTITQTGAEAFVALDVVVNENKKTLAIEEKTNAPPCAVIGDISNNGVVDHYNTIRWFFADESVGLGGSESMIEDVESRTLTYKIEYSYCENPLPEMPRPE